LSVSNRDLLEKQDMSSEMMEEEATEPNSMELPKAEDVSEWY
jgi:hypothetical protein